MNMNNLIKSSIKSITVEWSENRAIGNLEGQSLSFDQYNELAEKARHENGRGNGYDKTKIHVEFHGVEEKEIYRHDLSMADPSLIEMIKHYA